MVESRRSDDRRAIDTSRIPDLPADPTFDAAAIVVLTYLREHLPLALWSVSRVENGRQTYLYLDDNAYGMPNGSSVPWEETFCVHMSRGSTPSVAVDAMTVPEYAASAARFGVQVGTYAGAVINEPGGELFGAICGIDPQTRVGEHTWETAAPLLQVLGRMLSMILAAERRRDHAADELLRAQLQAETDPMTGAFNRRAWQRVVAQEETRLARYADPLVAIMMDLDRLKLVNDTHGHAEGDDYIRKAATALTRAVRSTDTVARLGGDEFGVLLPGCTEVEAEQVIVRIYAELRAAGVSASLGWSSIEVIRGFQAGLAEADAAMYAVKAERRASSA